MNRASSPGKQLRWPLIEPPPLNRIARSYAWMSLLLNSSRRVFETTPGITEYPFSSSACRSSPRSLADSDATSPPLFRCQLRRWRRHDPVHVGNSVCHLSCRVPVFDTPPALGAHAETSIWIAD